MTLRTIQTNLSVVVLVVVLAGIGLAKVASAEVVFDPKSPQMRFVPNEINQALASRSENASIKIEIDSSLELKTEGFSIVKSNDGCGVIGKDPAGAMYGGLDLAETIRSEGYALVQSKQHNPYMQMRGIKFNIPLDARTPSYTDVCDATQKNILEMGNMDFLKEYIDTLTKHRYNYVSLWSMHPFPSLVKVPTFPDVALADIKRSKGPFKEYYSLRGIWDEPELGASNLETIKTMTIDEKIAFLRDVMAYGKSRNVDFYIITWNIFIYGVDGKYGITNDPDNKTTIDYFRKSVKEKNIPVDVTQGYYYGHDGFISGREFTQLDMDSPRQNTSELRQKDGR